MNRLSDRRRRVLLQSINSLNASEWRHPIMIHDAPRRLDTIQLEMYKKLQSSRDSLLEQYFANLDDVYDLQDTLIHNLLPSVMDELQLGLEAKEWAKEWLSDTSSIFRISRRNQFTRSFCLEAVQRDLLWRFQHLWPLERHFRIPNIHCLPGHIRDPFGRPVLIARMDPIDSKLYPNKQHILVHAFESLRLHLRHLYDSSKDDNPTLQYVVLLDLRELSLYNFDLELLTWTAREVLPRFPGMMGAVFTLNYSWTHSGLWGAIRRLLPEATLSRIFFPSNKELIECLTASALPQEFGGSLLSLADLEDPIQPTPPLHPSEPEVEHFDLRSPTPTAAPTKTSSWSLSTSGLNPFYGYPIATSQAGELPTLRHGRRRKRDLLQTLAKLFWLRWRNHLTTALCLLAAILVYRVAVRKELLRSLRYRHPP